MEIAKQICTGLWKILVSMPMEGWRMFRQSPRAVSFAWLLADTSVEIAIFVLMSCVVFVLQTIDIVQGKFPDNHGKTSLGGVNKNR